MLVVLVCLESPIRWIIRIKFFGETFNCVKWAAGTRHSLVPPKSFLFLPCPDLSDSSRLVLNKGKLGKLPYGFLDPKICSFQVLRFPVNIACIPGTLGELQTCTIISYFPIPAYRVGTDAPIYDKEPSGSLLHLTKINTFPRFRLTKRGLIIDRSDFY